MSKLFSRLKHKQASSSDLPPASPDSESIQVQPSDNDSFKKESKREGSTKVKDKQRAPSLPRQKKLREPQTDLHNRSLPHASTSADPASADSVYDVATEAAKVTRKSVRSLKAKQVGVDQLEDLRDEMDDLTRQSNRVLEMLSRPPAGMPEVDDSELEAELDELMLEADLRALEVETAYTAPSVPSNDPQEADCPTSPSAETNPDKLSFFESDEYPKYFK